MRLTGVSKMKKSHKILLTIPSILIFIYSFTYMFPVELHWATPTMKIYYILTGILQTLTLIQTIIILKILWSFERTQKSTKTNWTIVLILFNSIASLFFIWKEADKLAMNEASIDEEE